METQITWNSSFYRHLQLWTVEPLWAQFHVVCASFDLQYNNCAVNSLLRYIIEVKEFPNIHDRLNQAFRVMVGLAACISWAVYSPCLGSSVILPPSFSWEKWKCESLQNQSCQEGLKPNEPLSAFSDHHCHFCWHFLSHPLEASVFKHPPTNSTVRPLWSWTRLFNQPENPAVLQLCIEHDRELQKGESHLKTGDGEDPCWPKTIRSSESKKTLKWCKWKWGCKPSAEYRGRRKALV